MTEIKHYIIEPRGPLFHYTSIQGLIGIFAERKIWATSIYHLNDKEELLYARDMFRLGVQALQKSIDTSPKPAILPPGYKENPKIKFLDTIYSLLNLVGELQIFVCSFSEAGDELSQWRGYCPSTYGFSIGFNYSQLKKHAQRQKFMLKKCIYDKKQQKNIVDQCIKTYIESALPSLTESSDIKSKAVKVFISILQVLPIIKNKYFKDEREWRLISSAFGTFKERVKFKAGKTAIIPYYEFELAKADEELPIESIIIGPTPNREESLHSVKAVLLKQNMSEKTKVIHSKIPYREI